MYSRSSSLVGSRYVGAETLPFSVSQVGKVAPFHTGAYVIDPSHSLFQTVSESSFSEIRRIRGMRRGRSSLFLGRLYFDLVLYI